MNGNAHKGMQTNIIGPQRPKKYIKYLLNFVMFCLHINYLIVI